MSDSLDAAQDHVALARTLAHHLETGNEHEAMLVLTQLAGFRDSVLFQEVGRLTRELHDSINSFVLDAGLADIARHEMPDAAERLRYVIATTEQAANATLSAVEDSLPLADSLRSDAHDLARKWAGLDFAAALERGLSRPEPRDFWISWRLPRPIPRRCTKNYPMS